jgi:hypothetical protein
MRSSIKRAQVVERLSPRAAPEEVISRTSFTASRPDTVASARPLPSPIRSSSPRITCSPRKIPYRDLGEAYLDLIDQTRTAANLKRLLERLGYIVQLQTQGGACRLKPFSQQGLAPNQSK